MADDRFPSCRPESIAASKSDRLTSRDVAISFSDFQDGSSRLTLVLWPATTTDRFTTRDFICGPTVAIGAVALLAFRDTLIDRDPASTGMCTLKRYRKKSSAASIFFSERSRTTVRRGRVRYCASAVRRKCAVRDPKCQGPAHRNRAELWYNSRFTNVPL